MDCGCEIDLDYDTGPEAFTQKDRTARKEHVCYECGRTIQPGEIYRYETGIWDGHPRTYKTCSDCLAVRDEFFCQYAYGELWSAMHDHIVDYHGELSTAKLANLPGDARDMVCAVWEAYWEEYEMENPLRFALRLDAKIKKSYGYQWKDWVEARKRDVENITDAYVR